MTPCFTANSGGHYSSMYGIRVLFLPTVWIAVGAIVAAVYDYFDALGTTAKILTAVAAVVLWPILPFGFEIKIAR